MAPLRRFARRLSALLRPDDAERHLDREIASHLAQLEDDFRRRGLSPDEARAAARRKFGGMDQTKELQREPARSSGSKTLRRDIFYTGRTLVRSPGFTAAAVLTLAIGIGGSTAVFSLFDAVLLRPLPFRDADRLVMVFEDESQAGFPQNAVGTRQLRCVVDRERRVRICRRRDRLRRRPRAAATEPVACHRAPRDAIAFHGARYAAASSAECLPNQRIARAGRRSPS